MIASYTRRVLQDQGHTHSHTHCLSTMLFIVVICGHAKLVEYLKIGRRDASRPLLSLLLLFVYFLALPFLLFSSIYLVAFYTCCIYFHQESLVCFAERAELHKKASQYFLN